MTREQFYKIRPKIPKISKVDPRRMYAAHFAEAYNSCDFDLIWDFISAYSAPEVNFVHRWVGQEEYFNFPQALEIQGWQNIAEYWYGRCLVAPDLVVELKETKLYVRSDGYSTVVGSMHIHCTRLYDGLISDALIVQSAATRATTKSSTNSIHLPTYPPLHGNESNGSLESEGRSILDSEVASVSYASEESSVEIIADRVEGAFDRILRNSEIPRPKKKLLGFKRKWQSESEPLSPSTPDSDHSSLLPDVKKKEFTSRDDPNLSLDSVQKNKRVIPAGTGITLLTTVTMQLNKDQKVKHYEMTFALKQ